MWRRPSPSMAEWSSAAGSQRCTACTCARGGCVEQADGQEGDVGPEEQAASQMPACMHACFAIPRDKGLLLLPSTPLLSPCHHPPCPGRWTRRTLARSAAAPPAAQTPPPAAGRCSRTAQTPPAGATATAASTAAAGIWREGRRAPGGKQGVGICRTQAGATRNRRCWTAATAQAGPPRTTQRTPAPARGATQHLHPCAPAPTRAPAGCAGTLAGTAAACQPPAARPPPRCKQARGERDKGGECVRAKQEWHSTARQTASQRAWCWHGTSCHALALAVTQCSTACSIYHPLEPTGANHTPPPPHPP